MLAQASPSEHGKTITCDNRRTRDITLFHVAFFCLTKPMLCCQCTVVLELALARSCPSELCNESLVTA